MPRKKKVETVETTEVETVDINTTSLKDLMQLYPNVSIRRLALESGITYTLMLKASKKPIPGELYNPESINYDAIEAMFAKRKISFSDLPWVEMNVEAKKNQATLSKDINDFEVGTLVYLRDDNTTPYEVVFKTETHIVILKQGSTEPRSLSHKTFITIGGPSLTPRTTSKVAEIKPDDDVQVEQVEVEVETQQPAEVETENNQEVIS